jgi:hypothetical protein
MKGGDWAVAVFFIIAALVLATHFSSTTLEYSRYNIGWNGTSQIFAELETHDALELATISGLNAQAPASLLIIAPSSKASTEETEKIKEFLDAGNVIFIADEEGLANSLLESLGSGIRVIAGNLSSVDMEYNDPQTVIGYATQGTNDTMTRGVESIICNRPATLEGGDPLITASMLSWVDRDGNRKVDEGEALSRYPILSAENIGAGRLYVLSDPSIFINGMQGIDRNRDNGLLIEHIMAAHPVLYVDQMHSRTAAADGILEWVNWVKRSAVIEFFALSVMIFGVAVAFYRRIL